jgi:hypothetical protein
MQRNSRNDSNRQRQTHNRETYQPDNDAEQKKRIALTGELVPGGYNLCLVARDAVNEHKLAPAPQPAKDQTYYYEYRYGYYHPYDYQWQIRKYMVFDYGCIVVVHRVIEPRTTTALAKVRQPGAEANRQPLRNIKRLKQHQSNVLDGRPNRIDYAYVLWTQSVHILSPVFNCVAKKLFRLWLARTCLLFEQTKLLLHRPVAQSQHKRHYDVGNGHQRQQSPGPAIAGLGENPAVNPCLYYGYDKNRHQYKPYEHYNKHRSNVARTCMDCIGTTKHIFSFHIILK